MLTGIFITLRLSQQTNGGQSCSLSRAGSQDAETQKCLPFVVRSWVVSPVLECHKVLFLLFMDCLLISLPSQPVRVRCVQGRPHWGPGSPHPRPCSLTNMVRIKVGHKSRVGPSAKFWGPKFRIPVHKGILMLGKILMWKKEKVLLSGTQGGFLALESIGVLFKS